MYNHAIKEGSGVLRFRIDCRCIHLHEFFYFYYIATMQANY